MTSALAAYARRIDSERPPDFLWHSAAPWDTSAYGQQTDLVVRSLLARGYRVELSVPTGGGRLAVEPFECWPADFADGGALVRNLAEAYRSAPESARALVFADFVRFGGEQFADIDLALYLEFNFDPPPPAVVRYLEERHPRVIVPSKWAVSRLAEREIECTWIPHSVDTTEFHPGDRNDRERARAEMGVQPGSFVVGIVAVNNEWESNRKSLPEALAAFAKFRRRHSDAVLFLHTSLTGQEQRGLDLVSILHALSVPPNAVVATRPDRYGVGLPRDEIASVYRGLDVLLSPSAGEGFGLAVVEAQACGVPAIVSDFSAQPELIGHGWSVGGQRRWAPHSESWLFTPHIGEIVDALELAYAGPQPPVEEATRFAGQFSHPTLVRTKWEPYVDEWLGTDRSTEPHSETRASPNR